MRTTRFIVPVALIAVAGISGAEDKPVVDEARIKALIAVLSDPEASGDRNDEAHEAIAELVKIGAPAAPKLVEVVATTDRRLAGTRAMNGPIFAAHALDEMGKSAVPAVMAVWPALGDDKRWELMQFRGKHDYDAALPFALASLDNKSEFVVREAVRYFGHSFGILARLQPPKQGLATTA